MEFNEFAWERQAPPSAGVALSAADVETMIKLMAELRELTLSRASYIAASDFLKRFGQDADSSALVRPEVLAN
jgi:hypothetical protein